ncbi:hypothetical protein CUMW_156980 [Citrus unshiu]|nr:hypothetical protein CUMW_156980 [Citrus unshiu]
METSFAGGNIWSEGFFTHFAIFDDETICDNLDLLVVPQYGRNLDYSG